MNRVGTKTRFTLPLLWVVAIMCLGLSLWVWAGEAGLARTGAVLRDAPYSDAKMVIELAVDSRVELLERRGAWLKVNAEGGASGWVRLHQVSLGDAPRGKKSSLKGLGMLWNLGQTGRSGASGIVATTGIRGLSAEDLKEAKPDHAAVESMETFQASDTAARRFAAQANLRAQNVAFIDD